MPATYSIRLRDLVRDGQDIGLWDYPIFDETYRESLNEKIINNYLMREIGCESPSIFAQRMHTRMCNIMPVYNQVYVATQREYDPFETVSMTTVNEQIGNTSTKQNETANSTNTSTNNTETRAIVSQYPSTRIAGHENYATSGTDTQGVSNSTGEALNSSSGGVDTLATSDGTTRTVGYDRPVWTIVENLVRSFVNVDLMIVGELDSLFMQLHTNNDNTNMRDDIYFPASLFGVGRWV